MSEGNPQATGIPLKLVENFTAIDDETKEVWRDNHQYRADLEDGLGYWMDWYGHPGVRASLWFICPCGCKSVHAVTVRGPNNKDNHPSWEWNGSEDKPTLRPSIQMLSPCRWHGWLTDGVFHT